MIVRRGVGAEQSLINPDTVFNAFPYVLGGIVLLFVLAGLKTRRR